MSALPVGMSVYIPSVVWTVKAFCDGISAVTIPPKLKKLVAPQVSMSAMFENQTLFVAPLTLPTQ